MAAPSLRRREMLAEASSKVAPATGINAALAVLQADLEIHQHKAIELKSLIARLEAYAAGTAPTPDAVDPNDARRAKQREAMRRRRATIKAAAAAAPPKQSRNKATASTPSQKPAATASEVPAAANGHTGKKRNETSGCNQRVELRVERLGAVALGDTRVADVHGSRQKITGAPCKLVMISATGFLVLRRANLTEFSDHKENGRFPCCGCRHRPSRVSSLCP